MSLGERCMFVISNGWITRHAVLVSSSANSIRRMNSGF